MMEKHAKILTYEIAMIVDETGATIPAIIAQTHVLHPLRRYFRRRKLQQTSMEIFKAKDMGILVAVDIQTVGTFFILFRPEEYASLRLLQTCKRLGLMCVPYTYAIIMHIDPQSLKKLENLTNNAV
jgi:hypothetical protein